MDALLPATISPHGDKNIWIFGNSEMGANHTGFESISEVCIDNPSIALHESIRFQLGQFRQQSISFLVQNGGSVFLNIHCSSDAHVAFLKLINTGVIFCNGCATKAAAPQCRYNQVIKHECGC